MCMNIKTALLALTALAVVTGTADDVVIENAFAELPAAAAGDAPSYDLLADVEALDLDAFGFENRLHFVKGSLGVPVLARAAVNHQNLHLGILSLNAHLEYCPTKLTG